MTGVQTCALPISAQRQLAALPAQAQDQLTAYAQGINSFHAEAGQALPPEFYVLRTQPGTWTAADSMGWGIMMALDLGGNWGLEFARLSAAQKLPTERLWQLFAPYPGEAPASQVDFAKLYAGLGVYNTAAAVTTATTATVGTATSLAAQAAGSDAGQAIVGTEIGNTEGKGSNNWVVAGSHTASGKPLLANDPHLGLSAPAIWYFARLHVSQDGQASNVHAPGWTPRLLARWYEGHADKIESKRFTAPRA